MKSPISDTARARMTADAAIRRAREPKDERAYVHEIGDVIAAIEANEAKQWEESIRAGSKTYGHCKTGPCRNGTRLCPTPDGCRIAQRSDPPKYRVRLISAVVLIAILIAAMKWYV